MNGPAAIHFHTEDRNYDLPDPDRIDRWIRDTVEREGGQLGPLNVIFCSDDYLLDINRRYLQHDTYTDIITFPYAEAPRVEGDIFISLDRVGENARTFGVALAPELYRVIIHGVLHLCGYQDGSPEARAQMRTRENAALARLAEAFR